MCAREWMDRNMLYWVRALAQKNFNLYRHVTYLEECCLAYTETKLDARNDMCGFNKGKGRQEDIKFKVILDYLVSSRIVWDTGDPGGRESGVI